MLLGLNRLFHAYLIDLVVNRVERESDLLDVSDDHFKFDDRIHLHPEPVHKTPREQFPMPFGLILSTEVNPVLVLRQYELCVVKERGHQKVEQIPIMTRQHGLHPRR